MTIISFIIEAICWVIIFSLCVPQGTEKKCVFEDVFSAVFALPIRTFGICLLFISVAGTRVLFGLPVALVFLAVLYLQARIAIAVLKKEAGYRV